MAMPFGKHKGTPLTALPDPYVTWLLEQDLRDPLKSALEAERARRGAQGPAPGREDDDAVPEPLRGDEERTVATRCPACGRGLTLFARLGRG